MIKDLVVPITRTAGDANALNAALAIASAHGAHLSVLEFENLPTLPAGPWGGVGFTADAIYRQCREEAEKNAVGWRERLDRESPTLSSEVRIVESLFADAPGFAALHARYADLTVMTMATDAVSDGAIIRGYFASLLLESGRPVLLVPPDYAWRPMGHVAVAWQPRREASRALHDAMPFLAAAESVDLVEVGDISGRAGDGPLPGADIAAHLARHGLKVRVVTSPMHSGSVALTLAKHARETRADLLVCGGYGHSRMREWAMGGVTRELLAGAGAIPMLFSH